MSTPAATISPARPARRFSPGAVLDQVFFLFAGVAAVWLAWLVLAESFAWGVWQIVAFVLFWLLAAYLVLPRLHRILTAIYVPGYFIGRARTSDGLLGDPINLAILGDEQQLAQTMIRSGWTRADPVTLHSSLRIVTSTLLRRSYDEAPVSPLLLFDRPQDVAYQQEVLGNPAKRHHVRFWTCPEGWMLPGGYRADWLAAGTFDRSVGFSLFTLQITHRIDADTDVERDHIVQTMTDADPAVSVRVVADYASGYHARNGGGDSIVTDGSLPFVDLGRVVVASPQPAILEDTSWRRPAPIVLGTALMLLRVLAGLFTAAVIGLNWESVTGELRVTGPDGTGGLSATDQTAAAISIGVIAAAMGLYLALTILVFRGSNAARITVMVFSALIVATSAASALADGVTVSVIANLAGLPLDVLVLLALSSQRARHWSRLPRAGRRRPV